MRTNATTSGEGTLELEDDATLRLPAGSVVRVERGTVLVTLEGDPEDYVLERGHALAVPFDGLSVAWAFTDASVRIMVAAEQLAA